MSREPAGSPTCPDDETLSAWLDEELHGASAESVSRHIEACRACCAQLFGWLSIAQELTDASELPVGGGHRDGDVERRRPEGGTSGKPGTRGKRSDADRLLGEPTIASAGAPCLDAETLVAYSESELDAGSAAVAERHLSTCTRCVAEVHRLLALRWALAQQPAAPPSARPDEAGVASWKWTVRLRGWCRSATRLDHWLRAIGDLARPRWAAVATVSAVAVLVLTVARLAPITDRSVGVQFRGAAPRERIEVISATAAGRPRPGDSEPILVVLERGTVGVQLEAVRDWTRVELADGRRVWVESAQLAPAGAGARATPSR